MEPDDRTTWREQITEALTEAGESWSDVEGHTMTPDELHRRFDNGYGIAEGAPFTLWTKARVYFPAVYDGSEWVESVPRHPNGEKTDHVGGQ